MVVVRDENNLTFLIIIIRDWRPVFENTGQHVYMCQTLTKFSSYLGVSFNIRMLDI